jgi:hypothetical protein
MMKATKFPFNTFPSKLKVCSNEEVTNEMMDIPSDFRANKMTPTNTVIAAIPK